MFTYSVIEFFGDETEPIVLAKGQMDSYEDAASCIHEELRMIVRRIP